MKEKIKILPAKQIAKVRNQRYHCLGMFSVKNLIQLCLETLTTNIVIPSWETADTVKQPQSWITVFFEFHNKNSIGNIYVSTNP